MASQNQHPAIPYDPLVEAPSSPRLGMHPPNVPYRDSPTPSGSQNLSAEFGAPNPGFIDGTYRSDSAASTTNFRGSNYGSIAPLQRDSNYGYPPTGSGSGSAEAGYGDLREKETLYAAPRTKTKKKGFLWFCVILIIIIIIAAVVVPVYFFVIKPKSGSSNSSSSSNNNNNNNNSNSNNGTNSDNNHHQSNFVTWGGDGSVVTKDDGTTFVYNNSLGGYWVYDPQNPMNNSARAQSYTPPLSQEWPWGSQNIYGVNLGGWLVIEPFIAPALFEPFYPNAVDEWTLHTLIQARDGNLNAIEEHYKTFITEEDFAQIAAAGLNWVRIPIPYWAIEVYPGEPYLPKVAWTYFLKAIEWARKYGIRINLDLHSVPGSQNGWNHSGRLGDVNLLNGVMGVANAQRTMDYIRVIAEFISQPEYAPVVPFFGILNEPLIQDTGGIPKQAIREFYAEAYREIRKAGNGYGAGKGPYISLYAGFSGLPDWYDFLPGADRVALDFHPYFIFTVLDDSPASAFPPRACSNWAGEASDAMTGFGLTAAGEWSNAINDCGLYVNRVGSGARYEGQYDGNPRVGSCDPWVDYTTWDDTLKATIKQVSAATMDALGNWFFWTWKIGASANTGKIMAPFWSYQLAVQEGWAVTDPRTSAGTCQSLGQQGFSFTGTLKSNQLGHDTAPNTPDLATYNWPPDVIGGYPAAAQVALLPTYTATGPIPTLPVATFASASPAPTGHGWNNPDDTTLMAVPIPGCAYPDAWQAVNAAVPNCAA